MLKPKSTPVALPAQDSLKQAGLALAGGLRLRVESGVHRGAEVISKTDTLTLGADPANDIALIAEDLAPRHARIVLTNPWRGKARIEAQDAAIQLSDGRRVDSGRFAEIALPANVIAGSTRLRLETTRSGASLRKFALPALLLIGAALVLPSLASVFTRTVPRFDTTMSSTGFSGGSTEAAGLESWAERMRERLRTAGLTGQVSVEKGNSGTLVALGAIEPASVEKWRDVVKWYDAQGGAPLLVNNVTRSETPTALPSFRAVWFDARPQVVLANGQSAGVGDLIGGGWKIEAIEASGVLVSREGRTTRIAF